MLIYPRFWGFLYYQHRHDICRNKRHFDFVDVQLTHHSTGAKLHHGHSYLSCHRNAHDMGVLR